MRRLRDCDVSLEHVSGHRSAGWWGSKRLDAKAERNSARFQEFVACTEDKLRSNRGTRLSRGRRIPSVKVQWSGAGECLAGDICGDC